MNGSREERAGTQHGSSGYRVGWTWQSGAEHCLARFDRQRLADIDRFAADDIAGPEAVEYCWSAPNPEPKGRQRTIF